MAYIPPNPNGQATSANSSPVVLASDQSVVPVSASSLPLPTGAATAAKQPALGTAGSASTDVITVQGIASGTPQPVSGTVTANAGSNLNTSLLALESGGNLATTATNTGTLAGAVTSSVVQENVKQINGVTPLMGNGITGTGSQRVTIASDNTAFSVNAVQSTAAAVSAGWPIIGGELADTTGTFTNGTQTTSVTSSSFDGYSTVIVSINGTYGTASGVFEISDDSGTTWYSVNAARSDGGAIETGYTSLTNTNRMWTLSVSGADQFRIRSTAVASGTVNVRISTEAMPTPEAASVTIPGSVAVTGSAIGSAVPAGAFYMGINNGGNLASPLTSADSGDAVSTTSSALLFRTVAENYVFNGTNWDRNRSATSASNTTGTGLLGVGNLVFDGTNYQRQTVNSTTTTSKFGADSNILSILGTAPTTAGKLDVKGADGDVFVRQATAANLNATVVGTGTFSVQTSAQVPGTGATNLGKAEDAAHTSGDTGVFALGVRNDGATTAFSNANGDYTPIGVDAAGTVSVTQKSGTATLTNVASSATNVTLLSSNTARKGGAIYNDSTQICYVKFGVTASSTSFTVPLAAATYYELPGGYTGQIDGIWVSANGFARITELS